VPAPRGPDAAAFAGVEAPDGAGRARGGGTAAAVVLPDADFFSLDLADAALLALGFTALAATFAVAPDELLVPP
jgi:hypothetical protein